MTVLIDPTTRDEPVDLSGAWLPPVDPSGHYVSTSRARWRRAGARPAAPLDVPADPGRLAGARPLRRHPAASDATTPTAGTPARATATGSAATPTAAASATASLAGPAPTASEPGHGDRPRERRRRRQRRVAAERGSDRAALTPTRATQTAIASPTGWCAGPPTARPTACGSAHRGQDTGVLLVAPTSADGREQDLLPRRPPCAPSRSAGRAAWVAPIDDQDGELRVVTWGPGGSGGVRLPVRHA